jgi:hypothetical protein
MSNYLLVSILSGMLFGAMDALVNANSLARRLLEVYTPIARTSANVPVGIAVDLVYGFVMAAVFLGLYRSLPGAAGWTKGLSFGMLAWFFRVAMSAVSHWMMFNVPAATLVYGLVTGLGEMLLLGVLYGLALRPPR